MKASIYGVGDGLVEIGGDIQKQLYRPDNKGDTRMVFVARDGSARAVEFGSCTTNPEGWHVHITSTSADTPSWPMQWVLRPYGDPADADSALELTVPDGAAVSEG